MKYNCYDACIKAICVTWNLTRDFYVVSCRSNTVVTTHALNEYIQNLVLGGQPYMVNGTLLVAWYRSNRTWVTAMIRRKRLNRI